jgi:hypothetical protein
MTIRAQDVLVYRGDTVALTIALTQADGSPFDPSLNAQIKWRVSRTRYSPVDEALVRKELGAGIELATGGVSVALESADTVRHDDEVRPLKCG